MLVLGMGAGTDHRHCLVDQHRHIRHDPNDGSALGDEALHEGRADARGERDHQLLRPDDVRDLLEERFHVLRLDRQDERGGPPNGLGVGERRGDAEVVTQLPNPFLSPSGHHELVGIPAARAEQARDQGLSHAPPSQERHVPLASLR